MQAWASRARPHRPSVPEPSGREELSPGAVAAGRAPESRASRPHAPRQRRSGRVAAPGSGGATWLCSARSEDCWPSAVELERSVSSRLPGDTTRGGRAGRGKRRGRPVRSVPASRPQRPQPARPAPAPPGGRRSYTGLEGSADGGCGAVARAADANSGEGPRTTFLGRGAWRSGVAEGGIPTPTPGVETDPTASSALFRPRRAGKPELPPAPLAPCLLFSVAACALGPLADHSAPPKGKRSVLGTCLQETELKGNF